MWKHLSSHLYQHAVTIIQKCSKWNFWYLYQFAYISISKSILIYSSFIIHLPSFLCPQYHSTLPAESQNGINDIQRCYRENHKGANAVQSLWLYSVLLILNGTLLNSINALLALNRQYAMAKSLFSSSSSHFWGIFPLTKQLLKKTPFSI